MCGGWCVFECVCVVAGVWCLSVYVWCECVQCVCGV